MSVTRLLAAAPDPLGSVRISPSAPILSYIAIVDGTSQDPAYVLQGPSP